MDETKQERGAAITTMLKGSGVTMRGLDDLVDEVSVLVRTGRAPDELRAAWITYTDSARAA